jgi:hypothetical protein
MDGNVVSRVSSTSEKLKTELETAEWDILKPHLERDALIIVSEELDLVHVATAVADGRLKDVELWMQKGLLTKPTPAQLHSWDQNPLTPFLFLIVQPWVLIQLRAN